MKYSRRLCVVLLTAIEMQDCNISFGGGGNSGCLDALSAGTGTHAQTLSKCSFFPANREQHPRKSITRICSARLE